MFRKLNLMKKITLSLNKIGSQKLTDSFRSIVPNGKDDNISMSGETDVPIHGRFLQDLEAMSWNDASSGMSKNAIGFTNPRNSIFEKRKKLSCNSMPKGPSFACISCDSIVFDVPCGKDDVILEKLRQQAINVSDLFPSFEWSRIIQASDNVQGKALKIEPDLSIPFIKRNKVICGNCNTQIGLESNGKFVVDNLKVRSQVHPKGFDGGDS